MAEGRRQIGQDVENARIMLYLSRAMIAKEMVELLFRFGKEGIAAPVHDVDVLTGVGMVEPEAMKVGLAGIGAGMRLLLELTLLRACRQQDKAEQRSNAIFLQEVEDQPQQLVYSIPTRTTNREDRNRSQQGKGAAKRNRERDEAGSFLCALRSQPGGYHAGNVQPAEPSTLVVTILISCRLLLYKRLVVQWSVLVLFSVRGIPGAFNNYGIRAPERAGCSL